MSRCVLLDGAFDPLHAGHVAYIRAARQSFPDHRIVVAIASDDQIREKGREPLLDQHTRGDVVLALKYVDSVFLKQQPTEQVLASLKPGIYVKGRDWLGTLPDEQLAACALHGIQIAYLGEPVDSSTTRLRTWARSDAVASLDRLETFMQAQTETPPERFDREYYTGDWRNGAAYTLADRRTAEGAHPDRIKQCFDGLKILDVGCGPGFLVTLMKEHGLKAGGIDTSAQALELHEEPSALHGSIDELPDKMCDVAICREVLEHMTVQGIGSMIAQLFRVSRRFVYLTTRFQDGAVFDAATDFDIDPTHISLLSQPFLRSLCVLEGGARRRDLESTLDHQNKKRCLVYEVSQ